MKVFRVVCSSVIMLTVGACASQRPVVYPNQHFKQVGTAVAQRDVDECMALAQSSGVRGTRTGPDAENVAINTGTGAASGAARGAVYGHAGKGAAAGAAGAAAGTIFRGVFRPRTNPAHHQFVERCLRERGYEVTGWQ